MINLKVGKNTLHGIEGVIFDKDGTIIELEPYWLNVARIRTDVLNAYLRLEFDVGDVLYTLMGFDRKTGKMVKVPEISHDGLVFSLIRTLRTAYGAKVTLKEIDTCFENATTLFSEEMDKYVQIKPGVEKLLSKLHRKGIKIGMITSDSTNNAITVLHRNKLLPYFSIVLGGDSVYGEKHTGKPYTEMLYWMEVIPEHCVSIGDMPVDIQMAETHNMLAGIGVYNGYTPLNKYTPYVVNSLREVHVKGF